jgi:hypothetical protein
LSDGSPHVARWTAAGRLEAKKFFPRVKGYHELAALAQELNPNLHARQEVG